MNDILLGELADRIPAEMADLEILLERAQESWQQSQSISTKRGPYLDSVALNLHSFYSGLERLFELIAKHIDGSLPEGKTWHQKLLLEMTEDRIGLRPAVIGHETAKSLDEFRRLGTLCVMFMQ